MDKESKAYFSNEALAKMAAVQGKIVQNIVIILWQNTVDASNSVEIIDALQIRFTNGERLTIGSNENGDGLDIVDYHFQETKKQLEDEFEGKIKLHALDASKTKMWQDVPGKTLNAIRITKEDERYCSDAIVLDMGEEQRAVSISPFDGLIIDYHEEV